MIKRFLIGLFVVLLICALSFVYCNNNRDITTSAPLSDVFYIVIDAGHGGFDGGAVASDGTIEKDLNLAIALKLDSLLKSVGFSTMMVRSEDTSTEDIGDTTHSKKVSDIKNRLKIMGKYKNSIYVSIHMNKYSTTQPNGAQVFYSTYDSSKLLAENIQASICTNVQNYNKRVVKKATKDIYLLHNAVAPAVIVECGFLSNKTDLENLKNNQYQLKMASSIAMGIIDYYLEIKSVK